MAALLQDLGQKPYKNIAVITKTYKEAQEVAESLSAFEVKLTVVDAETERSSPAGVSSYRCFWLKAWSSMRLL